MTSRAGVSLAIFVAACSGSISHGDRQDTLTVFRMVSPAPPLKVRIIGKAFGADNFLVETCDGQQRVVPFSKLRPAIEVWCDVSGVLEDIKVTA